MLSVDLLILKLNNEIWYQDETWNSNQTLMKFDIEMKLILNKNETKLKIDVQRYLKHYRQNMLEWYECKWLIKHSEEKITLIQLKKIAKNFEKIFLTLKKFSHLKISQI